MGGVEGKHPGRRRNEARDKPSPQPPSLSRDPPAWLRERRGRARLALSAVLTGPPRPLTRQPHGSQEAEKQRWLHGPARRPLCEEEDGGWTGEARRRRKARWSSRGKPACLLVPVVWCGWRRPRSFKGQAGAAGPGGAGSQERAPPSSALTSRSSTPRRRRKWAEIYASPVAWWAGSGAGVGEKASQRMEGRGE